MQVLHTWNNHKPDCKVKHLIREMLKWQKEGYLDRRIWASNIFPSSKPTASYSPDEGTQHSQGAPEITDQEIEAFKKEQLDPVIWVPKLCEHFNIEELKLLKEVEREKINKFLDGINNKTTQGALRCLLRELRCLYVGSFHLENMTDLPDIINQRLTYLTRNKDENDPNKFEGLIDELECTIWQLHQHSSSSYEFLTCVATLSLFNFSLDELCFIDTLCEKDIEKLSEALSENLEELNGLQRSKLKRAFVLKIALNNPFDEKVVRYVMEKLPNTVDTFDLKEIRKEVKRILAKQDAKAFEEKQKFLLMHFNSIFSPKIYESQTKEQQPKAHETVQSLLEDLGLVEYYPQKITYGDVIKLTEDALKDVNEKPSTLRELPWYFLRRLIGLDSTIRENGSAIGKNNERKRKKNMGARKNKKRKLSEEEISFSWDEDSTEERDPDCKTQQIGNSDDSGKSTLWGFMKNLFSRKSTIEQKETDEKLRQVDNAQSDKNDNNFAEDTVCRIQQVDRKEMTENVANSVHPLDLIYIIFLCADDFLRQELADQMSKCQYAVPFILPSPEEIAHESKNTILSWGLRTISRTYCEERKPVTKTLLNLDCPFVCCLSLGTSSTWKSRLLNKMLSPQQHTFWHEGLVGGERAQKVSQGMVEIAWHLPACRGNDKFETPLAFVNLRGDAHHYPIVTGRLSKWSTTTCIFTERINKELLTFLKNYFEKHLRKIILVVLYNPAEEKKHVESVEKLIGKLQLDKHQVISYPLVDSHFHTTYSSLRKSIETCIECNTLETKSLCTIIKDVKRNNWMKVDDIACGEGHEAAAKILSDIDADESDDVKSKILPCQSDLATREEIGKHEKEICRQKYIAESDLMRQYVVREEEKKWHLQWKQLQYPISKTFTHFFKYITNFNSQNRMYFLQSLKLGLNERSIKVLQPLYEEYHKCSLEEKNDRTVKRLKELDEQLTYSSLGLEHFFREMAVMYENIAALSERVRTKKTKDLLETLSKTMADIFLEGEAIEILDGDVVHCPVVWLKAVLNQIEKRENRSTKSFKVSAVGAQSSGKSTLFNTVFGLNVPVSSGRCTRGAYMQLVKLDEQLAKRLQCDYFLVIDSEGLMSRVSKSEDYDNELATFVIGLSDLTLVIIKGEGNEMQDVLPIAIHVFLRMNVLKEFQACHFVHQNMGAADVEKTMPIEIEAFVECLDEKTRAAAQEAWNKKYTQFTDVLYYDKNKDNTYVSGLLDGSPPMGKTDIEYSTTMQRLKGDILERLETFVKKKPCSTLGDFSKWMESIWEAVKCENFVFSFRNVLTVEAYKGLLRILDDKEWDIKTTMRDNVEKNKRKIRDELNGTGRQREHHSDDED